MSNPAFLPKFSLMFASSVSWQKVDKNGNVIEEEEDDITQGNGNVDPDSGSSTGGSTGGGSTDPDGGSDSDE